MKTITIASQKGGAGKSTLAAHLSVLADRPDSPALLLDMDPQGSLAFWHSLRSAPTPVLARAAARELPNLLQAAHDDGVEFVMIDTPPHDAAAIAVTMRVSDLVLIPTRPSTFDLAAVKATLDMLTATHSTHLVVINQAPARRGFGEPSIVTEARAVLASMGANVWSGTLVQRSALGHAIAGGLSVGELEPGGLADREISMLWQDVNRLLEDQP